MCLIHCLLKVLRGAKTRVFLPVSGRRIPTKWYENSADRLPSQLRRVAGCLVISIMMRSLEIYCALSGDNYLQYGREIIWQAK